MADTKRIQITLSVKLLENLDTLCESWGISRSAYMEYVLGQNVNTQLRMVQSGIMSVLGSEVSNLRSEVDALEIPNPE